MVTSEEHVPLKYIYQFENGIELRCVEAARSQGVPAFPDLGGISCASQSLPSSPRSTRALLSLLLSLFISLERLAIGRRSARMEMGYQPTHHQESRPTPFHHLE